MHKLIRVILAIAIISVIIIMGIGIAQRTSWRYTCINAGYDGVDSVNGVPCCYSGYGDDIVIVPVSIVMEE